MGNSQNTPIIDQSTLNKQRNNFKQLLNNIALHGAGPVTSSAFTLSPITPTSATDFSLGSVNSTRSQSGGEILNNPSNVDRHRYLTIKHNNVISNNYSETSDNLLNSQSHSFSDTSIASVNQSGGHVHQSGGCLCNDNNLNKSSTEKQIDPSETTENPVNYNNLYGGSHDNPLLNSSDSDEKKDSKSKKSSSDSSDKKESKKTSKSSNSNDTSDDDNEDESDEISDNDNDDENENEEDFDLEEDGFKPSDTEVNIDHHLFSSSDNSSFYGDSVSDYYEHYKNRSSFD